MKYTLKVYSIWEQGPREKQEDSMFPKHGQAKETDRLFVLCDGMGGHSAGEIASSTVCSAMSESIFAHCPDAEGHFSDDDFKTALNDAFNALDTQDNGAAKKMGTTLTFLKLHDEGATIAHIGDSRVYHIRPRQTAEDTRILFQTIDHSLVNDLIKAEVITPEEAKHSKQKNVITRAMQPNMERRPKADLYHTQDIRPGDYFMLCSDGILEEYEDQHIRFIFSAKGKDALNKMDMITKGTAHNHDNHSAIVVHITDVIGKTEESSETKYNFQIPELLMAEIEEEPTSQDDKTEKLPVRMSRPKDDYEEVKEKPSSNSSSYRLFIKTLLIAIATFLMILGAYFLYTYLTGSDDASDKQPEKAHTEQTQQV